MQRAHPDTITVRVPLAFRRRGGRKVVVPLDGSPRFASALGREDSALVKAIARAFRWRKLIETGTYATIKDLASAEKLNASYVGRVLRLTLLAPDIVEAILESGHGRGLKFVTMMKPFPVDWATQREALR